MISPLFIKVSLSGYTQHIAGWYPFMYMEQVHFLCVGVCCVQLIDECEMDLYDNIS